MLILFMIALIRIKIYLCGKRISRGILCIKKWNPATATNDLEGPGRQENLQQPHFISDFTDNIILFLAKGRFMKKNIFLAYKPDKLISIERLFGIMPSFNIKCFKN